MLKGLEVSVVKFSDVLKGVETFRLDAEYHYKEYERIEKFIKKHPSKFAKFSNWNLEIDCSAFYPSVEPLYGLGNIPLIRVQNVKEEIEYDNCVTLPNLPSDYKTLKFVENGDIVITKGGSIGFVGYVTKKAYASRDLIFINSSKLDERERMFLYLYLSTDFAFKQLIRSSSQCAQPHLTITLVKNFDMLVPKDDLKDMCYSLVKSAHTKLSASKSLYSQAEEMLLCELGLKGWQPKNKAVSIKTFSAFASSGRLDAEYYQSKYDELFEKLAKCDCKRLGDIVSIKKSVEPGSECYKESGIPFVRVSDVSEWGISQTELHLSPADFSLEALRPHKDTILLSKDGSIGIAYKCEQDMDVITSGALLHLTVIDSAFLPDYVTLVLNSIIVQLQAERDSNGAIIQHWKPDDIKRVIIPILPQEAQEKIAELIQRSFALRSESKQLLQSAKQAVEAEIAG